MQDDRPSVTALIAALGRAYHVAHERPPVFNDFLASSWFTDAERDELKTKLAAAVAFFDPEIAATHPDPHTALGAVLRQQSTPITLSRARYTEDSLTPEVTQYVILGAGLDTFAFRCPEMLERLDVFEVDHPATQGYKRSRIASLGWTVPERLHFVAVDLSRDDLVSALRRSAYQPQRPTLISWLGVTYYLAADAIARTLRGLAELTAPGSELVFDYLDDAAFDADRRAPAMTRMQEAVRRAGEPMQTGFSHEVLAAALGDAGWRLAESLSSDDIAARYFATRTDGFAPLAHFRIARAVR